MAKKENLPMEVHDHFRKANVLHGYVEKSLGEATKHALETGQELLAAKKLAPHGSWEDECKRLFDGSIRTAQFYMQFTRDVSSLPKAQKSAVLLLEGTLDGAAKAAKRAANPPKPKTPPPPPAAEPLPETSQADPVAEPIDTPEPPKRNGQPPKQYPGSHWYKLWEQSIGPICRLVDKIETGFGDSPTRSQQVVQDHLALATEEMQEWLGVVGVNTNRRGS